MIQVKLTTCAPYFPLTRQTPGQAGVWDDCQFVVDQPLREADAWVVFDEIAAPDVTACPPGNTVFITAEPPSVRTYDEEFLSQFATVVTCHSGLEHPNVIRTQQGLPWLFGAGILDNKVLPNALSYDALRSRALPPKTRCLSVVCSAKAHTAGHLERIAFVEMLEAHFGDRLDVFGRGVRDFVDKREVIEPYQYHLSLENSSFRDYWTEKLADCYLGGAFPIYYGCPNITDYFPASALTQIDLADSDRCISAIEFVLRGQAWAGAAAPLEQARDLVLNKYNLFAMIARLVRGMNTSAPRSPVRLVPCPRPEPNRWMARLRRKLSRIVPSPRP